MTRQIQIVISDKIDADFQSALELMSAQVGTLLSPEEFIYILIAEKMLLREFSGEGYEAVLCKKIKAVTDPEVIPLKEFYGTLDPASLKRTL